MNPNESLMNLNESLINLDTDVERILNYLNFNNLRPLVRIPFPANF